MNSKAAFFIAKLSIRIKILMSIGVVILLMGVLNVNLMFSSIKYNEQYNSIVTNITNANSINGTVKTQIDSEMWDIVAGKKKFEEGKQYDIINNVNNRINEIIKNVRSIENRTRLDVTLRTMKTLEKYVDLMNIQIKEKQPVAENEKILEEIRSVSSLVEDDIQEFILYEVKECAVIKTDIERSINKWIITNIIVFVIVLIFSMITAWMISGSITKPIRELHKTTRVIAAGNLDVRVENKNVDEIAGLSMSFNVMIEKIKELIENSKKEQENLKKSELKALQAQINPHFLYNTLDTIVWMAEANKTEQVIEIVKAFSNFFRITLSKGRDWISVRDEVEHIRSYLIIQKIRYRDILDFEIKVSEEILDYKILKLTLQPIVENALYHGVKNKRSGGTITIKGILDTDKSILFEIGDNGIGIEEDKLQKIQRELKNDSAEAIITDSGFGLANVQKRIRLYYGKQYGLSIESEYGSGTIVLIKVQAER
jgi:two-component system sensor histidine kinase YesM